MEEREELDFLAKLPREITIDIVSRLPIPSIIKLKLTSRACRMMVESQEFAGLHNLWRPDPHLLAFPLIFNKSPPYKITEVKTPYNCMVAVTLGMGLDDYKNVLLSSINGLILLRRHSPRHLLICNPITREYVGLPDPPPPQEVPHDMFGLGVSKTSKQYKVVRIVRRKRPMCQVYTLGTGQWRAVPGPPPPAPSQLIGSAFVGGKLHWLVLPSQSSSSTSWEDREVVSCFDLETEVFTTFSSVPHTVYLSHRSLSVLDDCLCLCDESWNPTGAFAERLNIWLMRDGRNWTKEFVINYYGGRVDQGLIKSVVPIKVWENGDILLGHQSRALLFYYSKKDKSIQSFRTLDPHGFMLLYTPTFLPLKTLLLGMLENVHSF